MSATDLIAVGSRLPRIRSVVFHSGFQVAIAWDEATQGGAMEVVDLAPLVSRLKFYAPLRDDEALRRSVHLIEGGAAIAWGEADEIDMAAGSVLRLAEEAWTAPQAAGEMFDPLRTGGRTAAA